MPKLNTPSFKHQIVHHRKDGYWIDKFYYHKDDKAPGLIVSGLEGEIEYLANPSRNGVSPREDDPNWVHVAEHDLSSEAEPEDYIPPNTWDAYKIAERSTPVPTASMDMTGNGYNDVIVAYNYGDTMIDSDPKGGDIIWLENPGDDPAKEWKAHFIGRWPTTHRLATGYFTQRSFPEIIAAPVVHGPFDKLTPVPLICFQKPDDKVVKEIKEWRKDVVDDGHFRVIHEIYKKSLDGPRGLDSLLVASMDGVARLYYEQGHWKIERINSGASFTPWQRENNFFPAAGDLWGAGTADAGKMGNNPFSYVVSNEPFHGPYVSLYTRAERGQPGNPWKRHVLDVYGTPTQKRCWGDGPIHNIVCADIDGDGNDEFLVSMFGPVDRDTSGNTPDVDVTGPSPNKGVWCYKILDLEKGIVAKWQIAPGSSARCTVGDFTGKGRADLASLSYHVKKYYREKDPVVTLHHNLHVPPKSELKIIGTLWGGEGMVYLPRPEELGTSSNHLTKDLVDVANYSISVEVHAPKKELSLAKNDGLKVLYGGVKEQPSGRETQEVRWPLGGAPFPAKETLKSRGSGKFHTHPRLGAIVLRLQQQKRPEQWNHASDVPVETTFDLTEQGINFPELKFIKVEDLWWGGEFKGYDFYNMTGFHFRLQDNKQNLCHMQFWTAGPGVQAEYHNHNDNAFKELHTCLSQGTSGDDETKLGGMWAPIPSTCDSIITGSSISELSIDTKTHPPAPPNVKHCGLKPLEEHGRIWHEDATRNAVYRSNNTVSYPAHQWAAGDGGDGKYIDVWMALEFDAWLDFSL